MLTKRASKTLIFLIFLSLISTFLLQTTIDVKAQEEAPQDTSGTIADQAFTINKDWLDVTATKFGTGTIDSGGKFGRLNVDAGGYGLTNFINHGEIAYDEESDTHVYMAEMTFPASVVLYTDCMIDDVYPDHFTAVDADTEWLHLKTYTSWFWKSDMTSDHYYTSYNFISTGAIDTHEYDGNLRLNIKVNPILPVEENDTISMNGLLFKVPNIRTFVDNAVLVDQSYGTCDDPQNFYTDNQGVIEVRKEDLASQSFSGLGTSSAKNRCGDGDDHNDNVPYDGDDDPTAEDMIDKCGLRNVFRYYGVTYTSGQIGQAFASSPAVGTTWSRSSDLNDYDEIFEFDSHIRLKPNIFYDMETFEIKHKKVVVDRYKENDVWYDRGLCDVQDEYTNKYTRIVGLGVQNIFVKLKYNFKVIMLMSIVPTSEEGETYLEDPEVYQGDIIWDNTFTGTTEVESTEVKPSNWFNDFVDNIGDWWNGIGDWFDGLLDDILGGWTDWWDKFGLWIIIIVAIVVVVIVLFVVIRIIPKRRQYGQPNVAIGGTSERKVTHR